MNRLHFCLLIPFFVSIHNLTAQNPDSVPDIAASVLSASGIQQNESANLNFSVGLVSQNLTVGGQEYRDQIEAAEREGTEVGNNDLDALSAETINIIVYPNPFVSRIHLSMEDYAINDGSYNFVIFDGTGNTIKSGEIRQHNEPIEIGSVTIGMYFLTIYHNGKEIKSIKLLKNNL